MVILKYVVIVLIDSKQDCQQQHQSALYRTEKVFNDNSDIFKYGRFCCPLLHWILFVILIILCVFFKLCKNK